MIIYKTVNLINGKIYIGKYEGNKETYLGSGLHLKSAINKYGRENFRRTTIDFDYSRRCLVEKEIFWIAFYKSLGFDMYNISSGGDGRTAPHSDETKIKMSLSQLGREFSEEHKHKLSLVQIGNKNASGNKGKRHSEETKNKLSLIRRGKKRPNISLALKGKQKSEEMKRKLSLARKGKKQPNISLALRGRTLSEEHKRKLSESHKKFSQEKTLC